MIVIDSSGKPVGGCGCAPFATAGFPMPLVLDPDTGTFKAVVLTRIDGVTVASLEEPTPKVQDDDDKMWRFVYFADVGGSPSMYFGDPDDNPGYPLLAYNVETGRIERAFTNQFNGQTVLRWAVAF